MEETIDLREYFSIIKKRFWIVILTTIVAVGISTAVSYFTKVQMYQAKTTLIVNVEKYENQPMLTSDQISAGQKLAVLYGEIIKSRAVLQPVIVRLGLDMSTQQLASMISISQVNDTHIMNLAVTDTNPDRAKDIANTIPRRLGLDMSTQQLASMISISQVNDTHIMNLAVTDTNPDRAKDIANTIPSIFTEEVKRTIKANGVEVLDPALYGYPMASNSTNKIAIAGVLGVMIGLFVIFLIEFLDNKIKTPQDIEKHLNMPILGVIPNEKNC